MSQTNCAKHGRWVRPTIAVNTLKLGIILAERPLRGPTVIARRLRNTAPPVTRVSAPTPMHERDMGPTTPFVRPTFDCPPTEPTPKVDAALLPTVPADHWPTLERVCVPPPVPSTTKRAIASVWRFFGTALVTAIVVALAGYIAVVAFYRFDTTWVTPTIVAQTDDNLKTPPYQRALADRATVALVPYANLASATPGKPLYACRLEMLWCRKVGTVVAVLPGEIQLKHPHRDATMRGQMIELHLDDPSAVREDVLFVGSKPLAL